MFKIFWSLALVLFGGYSGVYAQPSPLDEVVRLVPFTPIGQHCQAPFRFGDKLYYATDWQPPGQALSVGRIFSMEFGKPGASPIAANPEKTDLHASNLTLTPDGKTMYYTLCEGNDQKKCTIWSRKKLYEGAWSSASKLPDKINLRQTTSTHPAIGYDWGIKKSVLYFTSNRPGGKGGLDIWLSTIELDGTFGEPELLPFNTGRDETTPYFHTGERTLFFSSNGLPGEGGFDVFAVSKNNQDAWGKPANLGIVLNTPHNETYFTFHTNIKKGYFVSDRPISLASGRGSVQRGTHIYEITPVVQLNVQAYNIHNTTAVYGTMAHVYDETTSHKYIFREGPFDASLKLALLPDRKYKVVVLKDGYQPSVIETSTERIVFPTTITYSVGLFTDDHFPHSNRETYHEKKSHNQEVKSNGGKKHK